MNTEKEKSYPGFQMGTSFLLVLFVVICEVLLGVLSLSGALRDKGYSGQIAEKTKLYYEAVSAAQHKLGEIDKALAQIGGTVENQDAYLKSAAQMVEELENVSYREDDGRAVLAYEVEITESQALCVELEVLDKEESERYKIVKWQEVSLSTWEDETTLPVLFGEE